MGQKRRIEMEHHIEQFAILPMEQDLGKIYDQIIASSRAAGRELHVADALIVATSKRFDLTVLAHHRDMLVASQLGVRLICRLDP